MATNFRGDHWIESPPASSRPGLVTRLTAVIDRTQELRDELGETGQTLSDEVKDRKQLSAVVGSGFERLGKLTDQALSVGDGLANTVKALRAEVASLKRQGADFEQRLKTLEQRFPPTKKVVPGPRRPGSKTPPVAPPSPGKP